jgi:tetratricopeptide (TPR) repeat protein
MSERHAGWLARAVWMSTLLAASMARADADATAVARAHFVTAIDHYDAGRFAEALAELEAARSAAPLPELDYNIGRCHERLGHRQEAIDAYERFLAGKPEDDDALPVMVRVQALRWELAASRPPVTQPVEPPRITSPSPGSPQDLRDADPTPPPPVAPRRRVATWIVLGASGALLGGALAAGLVAHSYYSRLLDRCLPDGTCPRDQVPEAERWIETGSRAGVGCDVMLGLGAGAAVAATFLYFLEGRRDVRIAPTLSAGGAGLVLEVMR